MSIVDLRPRLTTYLQQRFSAFEDGFRHNLAVLGPLGSGKSVLLQQVLRASDRRVLKIFCSLQRDSLREFLRRFTASVLRAALDAAPEVPFDALLQHAAAVAPKTTAAALQLERYATGHLQAEGFVHALDLIPLLHQELNRPCVLVLDEFLYLEELGLSHTFHELGKRVMTWPFALFLVSSSSTFRAREILRERLHLLFGQFELLCLGPIETDAALKWMTQELPGAISQPQLMRFLLHWIGTSPWYLGVLLKRMRELGRLSRQRHRLLTEETLFHAAWDMLGSPDGALHQWCAAQIERVMQADHGPLAREALVALARGARTTQAIAQQCGTRRNLSPTLQFLVEHNLIQRKGACWVITDQLFACWLAAVLGPRQQRDASDHAATRSLFEQTLRGIWSRWLEATHQPLATRIGSLLAEFRNETVSLDHKTGRLPSFQTMNAQPSSQRHETYIVAEGDERRWCCLVHEGKLEETSITAFEQFCRAQAPRPSRKVVVAKEGLELNAKLLAKEASMWVWEPEDVNLLFLLYGQPPLNR
jgi:hypothetical protein